MKSIFKEISKLRSGQPITINHQNSNRYCVVTDEDNGSQTAYFFSTPIYDSSTQNMLELSFEKAGDGYHLNGSNSRIVISDNVSMKNQGGSTVNMQLKKQITEYSKEALKLENDVIYPTTNGIAYMAEIGDNNVFSFEIRTDNTSFIDIRYNDRYFCLMDYIFVPFVTVSCIGTVDEKGQIIAPATLTYNKISDDIYVINISPCAENAKHVMFEINMYEPKLFQDTTVESKNPKVNNAFGTVAFLGDTKEYGEQWLYSRLDYSRMVDIFDKKVHKAILHMPKLNGYANDLNVFKTESRFCSFVSNWDNKKLDAGQIASLTDENGYCNFDMTHVMTDSILGYISRIDGMIIKPKQKGKQAVAVSTADSCYKPQILEINYFNPDTTCQG